MRKYLAGLFAISEILAILIAGLILGGLTSAVLFEAFGIDPNSMEYAEQLTDPWQGALITAIQIGSRFFWLLIIAFLILWLVHGVTPRAAGVSRGGHSWLELLGAGLLLFAVATLPAKLSLLADVYFDFGEGIAGWQSWAQQPVTLGYIVFVLAAQMLLPPLFEEPFARGYMRVRLVRAFGAGGGVVLTGVLFMLAHGHFYEADALTLAFLASSIFAAICWAWVALRMGSVIPPIIAHALYNIPAPIEEEVLLVTIGVIALILLFGIRTAARESASFFRAFAEAPKGLLLFGLALVTAALGTLVLFQQALPVIGVAALVLMIAGWLPPMRRWSAGEPG
ncbi:MAG: CPBP family intramembrane glutamic endopeptidase [Alphaproteobacteria bacterium]